MCHADSTLVDCPSRAAIDNVATEAPSGVKAPGVDSMNVRWMHLCYVALGLAVARWIFRRQAVPVTDPVARFRTSGLL